MNLFMKRSIYKIENLSILMIYINLNKVEREPDNKLIEILKSNSTSARRKNKRLQFQRIQEKLRSKEIGKKRGNV
jgi:hypothetical protein